MRKRKSREDISKQPYLCKKDIEVLMSVTYRGAKKIFDYAMEIDRQELPYIIEPYKVRLVSVCKVTGQPLHTIRMLCSNGHKHTEKSS